VGERALKEADMTIETVLLIVILVVVLLIVVRRV
jgi:hypothetical protein